MGRSNLPDFDSFITVEIHHLTMFHIKSRVKSRVVHQGPFTVGPQLIKKRKAIEGQLSFFIQLHNYCGYRICVASTSAEVNPFQGRTNEFITELGSEVGVPEMCMPEVWLV
jgi:hypothetical protein